MQLEQYLIENNIPQTEFAALLGVKQATISRYLAGERIPSKEKMPLINTLTGGMVTANDFYKLIEIPIVAKKRPSHTTGNTKRQQKNPRNPPPL